MVHKAIKIFSLLIFISLFNSCYYDVEEELYPSLECDTMDMSYAMDVVPILESKCYQCHDSQSNFGNVTIDSYDALKVYVDDRRLLGVIKHSDGKLTYTLHVPASNLRSCSPFKSQLDEGVPDSERSRFERMLADGKSKRQSGAVDEAVELLEEASAIAPRHAGARYWLGRALMDRGALARGAAELGHAKDEDVCPLRATKIRTPRWS